MSGYCYSVVKEHVRLRELAGGRRVRRPPYAQARLA